LNVIKYSSWKWLLLAAGLVTAGRQVRVRHVGLSVVPVPLFCGSVCQDCQMYFKLDTSKLVNRWFMEGGVGRVTWPTFKIWDHLLTLERIKLDTSNLVYRWIVANTVLANVTAYCWGWTKFRGPRDARAPEYL